MNKQNYTNILLIIVLVFLGFMIFGGNSIRTDINSYNLKIEALQKGIDSVMQLNKELDENINSLKVEIKIIDSTISDVETNVNKIKKTTNEQIISVDNYTISELQYFFTERYSSKTE